MRPSDSREVRPAELRPAEHAHDFGAAVDDGTTEARRARISLVSSRIPAPSIPPEAARTGASAGPSTISPNLCNQRYHRQYH